MDTFIFVVFTFLPAVFILVSSIVALVISAKQYQVKGKSRKYPFMPIAIIGAILCIGIFLWHIVPYYVYVFYDNGQTNGLILLFWPTVQASIAAIPAVFLSAVLFVLSKRRNKSI